MFTFQLNKRLFAKLKATINITMCPYISRDMHGSSIFDKLQGWHISYAYAYHSFCMRDCVWLIAITADINTGIKQCHV